MSATDLEVFEKTVETTNIWLKDIMGDLGPDLAGVLCSRRLSVQIAGRSSEFRKTTALATGVLCRAP